MRTCSIIFQVLTGATDGIRDEYSLLAKMVAPLGDPEFSSLVVGLEAYVLGYCEGRSAEAGAIWAAQIADRTRTDFAGWTALYCWPDCPLLDGDHRAALHGFRAALQSARERGQSPTVAYQLEGMAMALSGLGRHEEALDADVARAAHARGRALTLDAAVNAALCLETATPGKWPSPD